MMRKCERRSAFAGWQTMICPSREDIYLRSATLSPRRVLLRSSIECRGLDRGVVFPALRPSVTALIPSVVVSRWFYPCA